MCALLYCSLRVTTGASPRLQCGTCTMLWTKRWRTSTFQFFGLLFYSFSFGWSDWSWYVSEYVLSDLLTPHIKFALTSGDLVITDLATATDLSRKRVDHAGANAVKYTNSGVLATLGQSNAGQLLLWDPRTGDDMSRFQRPLVNNSRGLAVADKDSYLTCLERHPTNEFEFYCGTSSGKSQSVSHSVYPWFSILWLCIVMSSGTIVMWDIRQPYTSNSGVVVELDRCQNNHGHAGMYYSSLIHFHCAYCAT